MNAFEWIKRELRPEATDSTEFIYNHMDSQSGRILPLLYHPFDSAKRLHWCDRGSCLDYFHTTGGGRLLDFGPGDGWPSLIVAPYADEIVGVDASARRVEVCRENAAKMGLDNVSFVHVPPGVRLPFDDNYFDGVMAASSVEQTPDPGFALRELYRVLRPGGKFRINYETLDRYRDGKEQEVWFWPIDDNHCILLLYNRFIDSQYVDQYALTLSVSSEEAEKAFNLPKHIVSHDDVLVAYLEKMMDKLVKVKSCRTMHPSAQAMFLLLKEAGFSEVMPTMSGDDVAGMIFDDLKPKVGHQSMNEVDDIIRDAVKEAVGKAVEAEGNPPLTAVK